MAPSSLCEGGRVERSETQGDARDWTAGSCSKGRGAWGLLFDGVVSLNFVHPLRALHASPSRGEGEEGGVLCFTLDSRVRGNDGMFAGMTGAGV